MTVKQGESRVNNNDLLEMLHLMALYGVKLKKFNFHPDRQTIDAITLVGYKLDENAKKPRTITINLINTDAREVIDLLLGTIKPDPLKLLTLKEQAEYA